MSDFLISFDFPAPGPLTKSDRNVGMRQHNKLISQDELTSIRNNALHKTFYTREDLQELLNQPDSMGIRIYPVIDSDGNLSTLAVATDSKRNDIVSGDKPCFVSKGFELASRISEEGGREAVAKYMKRLVENPEGLAFASRVGRLGESSIDTFSKVFFTSTDIENLMRSDSKGIHFYTTKIRFKDDIDDSSSFIPTLTAVRVNSDGEESSAGLMSALPCPPNCGGGYIAEAAAAEPTPPDLQA